MAEPSEQPVDFDKVVAKVREKVAERYRSGEYPPELERDMSRHYDRLVDTVSEKGGELLSLLIQLDQASAFSVNRISNESSLPGGSAIHSVIGRLVSRQTDGLVIQLKEFTAALRALLQALIDATTEPPAESPKLEAMLDQLAERARLLALQAAGGPAAVEALRTARARLGERQAVVELVVDPDAAASLGSQPDAALDGVIAVHQADLRHPHSAQGLLALASAKLKPGGLLVAVCLNPDSALTTRHGAPGPSPDEVRRLASEAGFSEAAIEWPDAPGERLRPVPDAAGLPPEVREVLDRNWELLNRSLFAPGEYVLVATR